MYSYVRVLLLLSSRTEAGFAVLLHGSRVAGVVLAALRAKSTAVELLCRVCAVSESERQSYTSNTAAVSPQQQQRVHQNHT